MNKTDAGIKPKLSSRSLKIAVYGLILIFTSVLQSLPDFPPHIFGVRPILMVSVTVCIAMFEGPLGGAAAGVVGGILWDLFSDRVLGFNAFLLLILCCACGLLSQLLIRNNLLSSCMMAAAALFVQGIADWFFNGVLPSAPEPFYALFRLSLPTFLYSLVVTPLLYAGIYEAKRFLLKHDRSSQP